MSLIKQIKAINSSTQQEIFYDIQAFSVVNGARAEATPAQTSNDTTIATTAFVKNALQNYAPTYEPAAGTQTGTLVFGANQVTDDGIIII